MTGWWRLRWRAKRQRTTLLFSPRWRLYGSAFFFLLLVIFSIYCAFSGLRDALPFSLAVTVEFVSEISLSVLVASLCSAFLLILASFSSLAGRFVAGLSSFMLPIPVTAFIAIFVASLPFLPAFCVPVLVGFIGGFGLVWRIIHEIVLTEKNIPSSYIKTAKSLGLGPWRVFWSIRLPILSFALWRGCIKDIPDFWVRLLVAGTCLGNFGNMLGLLRKLSFSWKIYSSIEVILILVFLTSIFFFGIIKPASHYIAKYRYINLAKKGTISIPSWTRISVFLSTSLWFLWLILSEKAECNFIFMGYNLVIIMIVFAASFVFWLLGGSLFLDSRKLKHPEKYVHFLILCAVMSTLPFPFPIYIVMSFSLPLYVPVFLAIQANIGLYFISFPGKETVRPFVETARHLHLSFVRRLYVVFFPLLVPPLIRGLISTYALLWNVVFLLDLYFPFFSSGTEKSTEDHFLHSVFSHDMGQATGFSLQILLLSVVILSFILYPLQARFSRKYKVL